MLLSLSLLWPKKVSNFFGGVPMNILESEGKNMLATLPASLAGVTLAENLGVLGMAALVSPGGLHDAMYHSDAGKSVPPREGLADVFRVAQEYQRVSGSRRLKSAVEDIALRRDPIDEAQATKDLYRLADDFGREPFLRHQRTVAVLLRQKPEWFGTEEAKKDFFARLVEDWEQEWGVWRVAALVPIIVSVPPLVSAFMLFRWAESETIMEKSLVRAQGGLLLCGFAASMIATAFVLNHRASRIKAEQKTIAGS